MIQIRFNMKRVEVARDRRCVAVVSVFLLLSACGSSVPATPACHDAVRERLCVWAALGRRSGELSVHGGQHQGAGESPKGGGWQTVADNINYALSLPLLKAVEEETHEDPQRHAVSRFCVKRPQKPLFEGWYCVHFHSSLCIPGKGYDRTIPQMT